MFPRSLKFSCLPFLSLAALLVMACSSSPSASGVGPGMEGDKAWAAFDAYALSQMKSLGITGMAVSVADSKGEIRSSGYGLADKKAGRAFDPDTISNIGSVSKLFTCAAVMRLVEEGRVDLDAPVSAYLSDFRPAERFPGARPITVRDLLTHHSGIPSDYVDGFRTGEVPGEGYPDSIARNAILASSRPLANPPGTVFSYSNLSYGMLGLLVERVSGLAFDDFCRREIFDPLKMESASFIIKEELKPRYALGYSGGKASPIPYIRDLSAGSLNLSSRELSRFGSGFLAAYGGTDGFLKAATVREMLRKQNEGVALDADFSIGLTWWLQPFPQIPGVSLASHGGDLPPFHALLAVAPELNLSVSILVNSENGTGSFDLDGLASQAIRAALAARGRPQPPLPAPAPARLPMPEEIVQRVSGAWASQNGLVEIVPAGKGVSMRAFGQKLSGYYRADGSIGLEARILGIKIPLSLLEAMSLSLERFGREEGMYVRLMGFPVSPLRRVQVQDPGPAWRSRIGEYLLETKESAAMISGAKAGFDPSTGIFCVSFKMGGGWTVYPVKAESDALLVLQGSGRNLGEGVTWTDADGGRLEYSGLRFRKK